MTEKETLQGAADEARKAARAAREFAALLDDYAKHVTQPGWRQKADDLHYSAMSKLRVVNDGLAACNKFIAASGDGAPARPEQAVEKKAGAKREAAEEVPKKSAVRYVRKGGRKGVNTFTCADWGGVAFSARAEVFTRKGFTQPNGSKECRRHREQRGEGGRGSAGGEVMATCPLPAACLIAHNHAEGVTAMPAVSDAAGALRERFAGLAFRTVCRPCSSLLRVPAAAARRRGECLARPTVVTTSN